jgi:hypothetical protein
MVGVAEPKVEGNNKLCHYSNRVGGDGANVWFALEKGA